MPNRKTQGYTLDVEQKKRSTRKIILAVSGVCLLVAAIAFLFMDKKPRSPQEAGVEKWYEFMSAEDATEQPAESEAAEDLKVANQYGRCQGIEYLGSGQTQVKAAEADKIRKVFSAQKVALAQWLKSQPLVKAKTMAEMEKRLKGATLTLNSKNFQDLKWRGIGIARHIKGQSVVEVGPGFVELFQRHPVRAKFELTRLLAQLWSPCALRKASGSHPWDPVLNKCLAIKTGKVCRKGSLGDEAWAVSTVVASLLVKTECIMPAFADDHISKCLKTTFSEAKGSS